MARAKPPRGRASRTAKHATATTAATPPNNTPGSMGVTLGGGCDRFPDYDVSVARSLRLKAGILTVFVVAAAPLAPVGPPAQAQTTADCVIVGNDDLSRYVL